MKRKDIPGLTYPFFWPTPIYWVEEKLIFMLYYLKPSVMKWCFYFHRAAKGYDNGHSYRIQKSILRIRAISGFIFPFRRHKILSRPFNTTLAWDYNQVSLKMDKPRPTQFLHQQSFLIFEILLFHESITRSMRQWLTFDWGLIDITRFLIDAYGDTCVLS